MQGAAAPAGYASRGEGGYGNIVVRETLSIRTS